MQMIIDIVLELLDVQSPFMMLCFSGRLTGEKGVAKPPKGLRRKG
jgi:hypothetical protein